MDIEVITLHAFSDITEGGKPAGVVLQAEHLSASQMQEIARQVGFSETAFVMPSNSADYNIRYFTPNHEVDLCGHATVALFYFMKAEQMVDVGRYTLDTLAGILEVTVEEGGDVYLSQTLPQFGALVNRQDIADSLQIPLQDLHPELPVQIVSTGLRDILIPVRHPDVLTTISPTYGKSQTSAKYIKWWVIMCSHSKRRIMQPSQNVGTLPRCTTYRKRAPQVHPMGHCCVTCISINSSELPMIRHI